MNIDYDLKFITLYKGDTTIASPSVTIDVKETETRIWKSIHRKPFAHKQIIFFKAKSRLSNNIPSLSQFEDDSGIVRVGGS